ncbi:DUF4401 domain-containing protein [Marinobacter xestospongiae]|uniref:DUF4401 domain-containing protein n=1 Tax=Marinobacter xestospongiae TaxID=994319 RepID=A0ABU3VU13_9GAMM|nr:DUF4401 domain-containing protein [Marinobacter xestospongiae]MDV2077241.1 DUF4401 domain-containing protein [Marinobacter xestospongiae]
MTRLAEQLREKLQDQGIELAAEAMDAEPSPPWYLRVMTAIGAWFSALFLLGFLVLSFNWAAIATPVATVLGLLLMVAAWGLQRVSVSDYGEQVGLVLSLAGQGLWLYAVVAHNWDLVALIWWPAILVQVVLAVVMPSYVHRLLSGVLAGLFLANAMAVVGEPLLTAPLLWLLVALAWLWEFRWPGRVRHVQAVAGGVSVALVLLTVSLLTGEDDLMAWLAPGPDRPPWVSPELAGALCGLVTAAVAVVLMRRANSASVRPWRALWLGVPVLVLLSVYAPGLAVGMGLMMLGFAGGNWALMALALTCLLGYGSAYYYLLELTLMTKSLILMAVGAGLLLVRLGLTRFGRAGQ